ncbi:hypothetical protein SORBI_3004G072201 [Sorghum bicolor]|uniref:Uncharacterized protein n=1 Tax=Sorghum bicolor TaxID=4558 RepID=A0A1Z5RLB5_SORBI|nr:hypothetical protein SORBI_3004G072201 [Sorghum bicolor]
MYSQDKKLPATANKTSVFYILRKYVCFFLPPNIQFAHPLVHLHTDLSNLKSISLCMQFTCQKAVTRKEIKPNFSNLYSFNSAPFLIKSRYCFSTLCQMGKVFCISLNGCKARKVAKASRIC